MSKILVMGATGNVGSRITSRLAARGEGVRAFVRRGEQAAFPANVTIAQGDYDDVASVRAALEGIDRVYLLAAGAELARHEATVIDAAVAAGVAHVVKHSVAGAPWEASSIPRWHRAGEKALERSGLAWTFLRPASFASNALGWAGSIRAKGTVYGALGECALPVIDPDDIADVAVQVLTSKGHEGKAYELSGPEALTSVQQVAALGTALGRTLAYVDVSDAAARDGMLSSGMPAAWVDAMLELVAMLRSLGRVEPTDGVQTVLGRPPRSFAAWAATHVESFR